MDLKQGISRQLTKINLKTSSFMEETKIKTYIDTLENEIAELKKQCGEVGYQMWAEKQFHQERLIPIYQKIEEKYCLIMEQKQNIEDIRRNSRTVLGNQPDDEKHETSPTGESRCPNCGEVCMAGMKFCRRCGTRLME